MVATRIETSPFGTRIETETSPFSHRDLSSRRTSMVNRGRSAGCITCKQRRVKCDEAKPACRACRRLDLVCHGYGRPKYARLRFKDETHKFEGNVHDNNAVVHASPDQMQDGGHLVQTAASSPAPSSELDVPGHGILRATAGAWVLPTRISYPDFAVPFFLAHYASIGRDLESSRGFFELLIPVYRTQTQDSALSLAVSTLASEILSFWQHDHRSFRSPRKSYSKALARLQAATEDPTERSQPATMLAVLTLQTYENACAVYHLRPVSSTHHNGAASLLELMETNGTDGTLRAYLRKFMLHTEVSSALRQEKPVKEIAYSWLGSEDSWTVSDNPSSTLDAIGVSVAELQASYTAFVQQNDGTTSPDLVLASWRAEARRLDADLLMWADTVPEYWRPVKLTSGPDMHPSIPSYLSTCEVYPSCQIASIWNLWRFQRLLLVKIILGSLDAFLDFRHPGALYPGDPTDLLIDCQTDLQEMVNGVCFSIPFHLGNRTSRVHSADFSDPTIKFPSQSSYAGGQEAHWHGSGTGMSKEDHRRASIAQGPWRVMHPLSRLVTLFSGHQGEVMASFLRPGQKDWVRDQFLRVVTLLHLPSHPGSSEVEGSGAIVQSTDARAEYLARGTRKGAILMSGP